MKSGIIIPTVCYTRCAAPAPKGSKQFERISWDEALDEIVTRWKAIIAEHGPQAIVPYSYLGNQGLVHGLNGGDAFFNRMGATVTERTFCGEGSCTVGRRPWGQRPASIPKALFMPNTSSSGPVKFGQHQSASLAYY